MRRRVGHLFDGVGSHLFAGLPQGRFGRGVRAASLRRGEVDDKTTGEKLYPASTLLQWKARHEGTDGPALAALGTLDEGQLTELLENAFAHPATP